MVVLRPSGYVAVQQGRLVVISTLLMLVIIVPVIALTLVFAWRYRASNEAAPYTPDWDHSIPLELVIWAAPLLIIIALGGLTWIGTHTLDPYRPLTRIDDARAVAPQTRPLIIEAVALDWKWLFIYPDLDLAVVNEAAAPIDTPIRFRITSSSVMNSLFVPALAGQIYAMPGMETTLHAVVNQPGTYDGFSANYSGEGFSNMRFKFRGMSAAEFDRWAQEAKTAGSDLTRSAYLELAKPSERGPVRRYRSVASDLFGAIVNRCVEAGKTCLRETMALDMRRTSSNSPALALAARANLPGDTAVCTADNAARGALLPATYRD